MEFMELRQREECDLKGWQGKKKYKKYVWHKTRGITAIERGGGTN